MNVTTQHQSFGSAIALSSGLIIAIVMAFAPFSILNAQDTPTQETHTPGTTNASEFDVNNPVTPSNPESTDTPATPSQNADVNTKANVEADADTDASTDTAEPTFDEIPWELRPYRVLISLAYGADSSLTSRFRTQLQAVLNERIAGVVGPYWQFEIETNTWLVPATRQSLERQATIDLKRRFEKTAFDKVLVLNIEDRSQLMLAGWEWDKNSETRSAVLHRPVVDRRLIAGEVFNLIIDLFRPVARIDATAGVTAELRARGAELLAPESLDALLQTGDLLTPHYRYLTREGEVRSVQPVPWTYLRVDDVVRSRLACAVETAFAAALTSKRRRVELMAIRIRPTYPETRLRLVPRTNPNLPLVGVRTRVYDELPSEEMPDPPVLEFMTDRSGTITVPTDFSRPMRRLLVHSGGAVLANLPFVTGLVQEVTLQVPDDAPRLEVEGNLAIIQGELIDLVSRRSVMLARSLSMARKEDWDESDRIMTDINKLPTISQFQSRIIAVRVPGIERAQANRDRAAQKRINKMSQKLEELVDHYLETTPIRDAKAEIKELRQLSKRSKLARDRSCQRASGEMCAPEGRDIPTIAPSVFRPSGLRMFDPEGVNLDNVSVSQGQGIEIFALRR